MTQPDFEGWHRVGSVDSLRLGSLYPLSLAGRDVVVVRTTDGIFCFDDQCAHQPVRLSDFGEMDGCHVVCHAHGARFDLQGAGKPLCFPAVESIVMHRTLLDRDSVYIKI